MTETSIEKELTDKNFEKIISSLGYIKKSKIIENFLPSNDKTYSDEVDIKEANIELNIKDEDLTIDKFQEDSKYITSPTYVDKYNFI
jgi:hypothetical protein